jgi:hypothetical protein
MNNKIEWKTEKRRVKDLIPYELNPRQITRSQLSDLKESLNKFDLVDIPIINTDNVLIGGHQRASVLMSMGRQEELIDVRVPSKKLSINELKELNIRLNKNQAEWNFDILANSFDVDELKDWGFNDFDLKIETAETKEQEKKCHYSFNNCYSYLKTKGVKYYSLFRNNDMDLEILKTDIKNINVFIYPLVVLFKKKKIKNVVLAPKGDRFQKNGFHFMSEIIFKIKEIIPINVYEPFSKNGNKIIYKNTKLPENVFIFDDIVTFGTTIKKMTECIKKYAEVIVLITNH